MIEARFILVGTFVLVLVAYDRTCISHSLSNTILTKNVLIGDTLTGKNNNIASSER